MGILRMRYYMAISDDTGANIGGGATNPNFSGWFNVTDFSFGIGLGDAVFGGGTAAGENLDVQPGSIAPFQVSLATTFRPAAPPSCA